LGQAGKALLLIQCVCRVRSVVGIHFHALVCVWSLFLYTNGSISLAKVSGDVDAARCTSDPPETAGHTLVDCTEVPGESSPVSVRRRVLTLPRRFWAVETVGWDTFAARTYDRNRLERRVSVMGDNAVGFGRKIFPFAEMRIKENF